MLRWWHSHAVDHQLLQLKAGWAEADLPNFDDELLTATRKAFAEVEQRKKNYIQRLKEERVEEMEENKRAVEQMEKEEAKEKEWAGRPRGALL